MAISRISSQPAVVGSWLERQEESATPIATERNAALLPIGPLAIFVVVALPAALRTPVVAEHAEFSGPGSRTGPQIHHRDSYRVTVTATGGPAHLT